MSLIRDYLSMESHGDDDAPNVNVEVEVEVEVPEVQEVSEEEEYEADDHLDESEGERREIESAMESFDLMVAEAESGIASLEHYQEVLEFGLENGQFSPQFAAAVNHQLSQYRDIFGDQCLGASLEDYGHDNLQAYYEVSLEGVKETISKMGNAISSAASGLTKTITSLGTNERAADAINKKADALLNKRAFEDSTKISLSGGMAKAFNFDGVIPDDIAKAMITDQRSIDLLISKFLPATSKYAEKALEELVKAINADAPDGPAKAIIGTKLPRVELSENVTSGKALLGYRVNVVVPERDAINSKQIKEITSAVAKGKKVFVPVKAKEKKEITVTRAQAESIARSAKVYAELLRKLSKDAKKNLKQQAEAFKKQAVKDDHGTMATQNRGNALFGNYLDKQKGKVVDTSEKNVALNAMVQLVNAAAKESPRAYMQLSSMIEGKAKAALKLASRATGSKKGEDDEKKDDE